MHPWDQLEREVYGDRAIARARARFRRAAVGYCLMLVGSVLGVPTLLIVAANEAEGMKPVVLLPTVKAPTVKAAFIDAGTLRFNGDVYVAPHQLGAYGIFHGDKVSVPEGSMCTCFATNADAGTPASCATRLQGTTLSVVTDVPKADVRYVCFR